MGIIFAVNSIARGRELSRQDTQARLARELTPE